MPVVVGIAGEAVDADASSDRPRPRTKSTTLWASCSSASAVHDVRPCDRPTPLHSGHRIVSYRIDRIDVRTDGQADIRAIERDPHGPTAC